MQLSINVRHELRSDKVIQPTRQEYTNFDTIRNNSQSKVLREMIAIYWDVPVKFMVHSEGKMRSFKVLQNL
jgi:hypothetical protein